MMEEEFLNKFRECTGGKFDSVLKLSSAVYKQSTFHLYLEFIAEYDVFKDITDEDRKIIDDAMDKIFPKETNSEFSVSYEIKPTHADKTSILNTTLGFLAKTNTFLSKYVERNSDSLKINLDPREIELTFELSTPNFLIFKSSNIVERLQNYLEHKFIQGFLINSEEIEMSAEELSENTSSLYETEEEEGENRTIEYKCKDLVFARFKVTSVSNRAKFIMDAKPPVNPQNYLESESIFCGKISDFTITRYKNKNFNPDEPGSEPEEKVRANFILNDTTGKINCVIFIKNNNQFKKVNLIHDDEEVVCIGSVSEYNGKMSYSVSAIFNADINYDSIVLDYVRPTPKKYKTVFPQPYKYEKVSSTLVDDTNPEINTDSDYFRNKTFVVFDTECTGKSVNDDEIIEIGAIKVVDGIVTESFETLINPGIHIPDELTEKVHHISDDMVADKPSIYDVLDDFYLFTRGAILVGHNINQFDYPFVNKYMQKVKFRFDNDTVDTLVLARKWLAAESQKFDLATLTKLLSLTNESAHRALSDVIATFELLQVLSHRM